MENPINRLVIRNFKSIQHIDLPCKRVNVFIGEPNVGKSNILEAMSLLGAGYTRSPDSRMLSDLIRFQRYENLVFDEEIHKRHISVETDLGGAYVLPYKKSFFLSVLPNALFLTDISTKSTALEKYIASFYSDYVRIDQDILMKKGIEVIYRVSNFHSEGEKIDAIALNFGSGGWGSNINRETYKSIVKKYDFHVVKEPSYEEYPFLLPPYGVNLFDVIRQNKEFHKECVKFFSHYGLNLVYRQQERIFEVQKNVDGIITAHPYSNMADTLQRIIFYLTAIESNKNSVLLFEEPEAHAFPPYTAELADRIALDDENQYFLTTHSPYLLNTLLSALGEDELNLVLVYYEDYETKVKALSQEEIKEAISDNFNLFFNLDKFLYAKEELHD